jgi:hypothetical protein
LARILQKLSFRRFFKSKRALALPVTFLILFVSTLCIISVTYYFSFERISSQGQSLKVSTAKQDLVSLNDVVLSTLWQPGSSGTFDLGDSGGQINIQPTNNVLTISLNDNSGIDETIFSSQIGKITYELPYSSSSDTGLYLKGDCQTIANQSGATPSQLYIANGQDHPEIRLRYRPEVSYAAGGLENGKAVNNIRLYIVNLNSSDPISLYGELPLKISCTNTQLTTKTYTAAQPENLVINSQLDDVSGSVSIPISSGSDGAVIYVEMVVSNVSIARWIH